MATHSPDVIVIGGGIIGASIAWKLARARLRVTLVDAGPLGGEASWAGAGMLAPGGEIVSREPWLDLALESMASYPDFVAELNSETGVTIDYRLSGGIDVAFDEGEWQTLSIRAEKQRALGICSSVLDRQSLRDLLPLCDREYSGVLFYPDDTLIDAPVTDRKRSGEQESQENRRQEPSRIPSRTSADFGNTSFPA